MLFDWLIKKKYYLDENPVVKVKSINHPIHTIPDDDFNIILKYLKGKNINGYNFIKFLKLTGCRLSEGINMKWENVDFRKNLIYINNTKEHRIDTFPMYKELKEFLLSIKQEN